MTFENTKVYNLARAVYSARNAKDSWAYSDSNLDTDTLGVKDLELAKKLFAGGSPHRKFLRQIFVVVDITAPRYFWTEFDTYKVGTTSNSCSTMHTIGKKAITPELFEIDEGDEDDNVFWELICSYLELQRIKYNKETETNAKNRQLRKLKRALPEGFLQKRTITLNYEVIANMYQQRHDHRLKEWRIDFVKWVKSLPYAQELITNAK